MNCIYTYLIVIQITNNILVINEQRVTTRVLVNYKAVYSLSCFKVKTLRSVNVLAKVVLIQL